MAPAAPVALAALLLVAPHFPYYLVRSWTEPVLSLLLLAIVLLIARHHPAWAAATFALALASKQPVVLLVPVMLCWTGFGWRRTTTAVVLAAVVVAPWFIAGPGDFWHDAVSAELSLGPLQRALSVPSGLSRAGIHLGFWLLVIVLLATYAVITRRAERTPAGLALSVALVLYGYDLANTQSFFNHYQLPAALLLAAVALGEPSRAPAAADSAVPAPGQHGGIAAGGAAG
jgi:hypothetical protein